MFNSEFINVPKGNEHMLMVRTVWKKQH